MGLFSRRKEPSVGADGAEARTARTARTATSPAVMPRLRMPPVRKRRATALEPTARGIQQRTTHKRRASTSGPCWFRPTPPTRRSNCRCKPIRTPASSLS